MNLKIEPGDKNIIEFLFKLLNLVEVLVKSYKKIGTKLASPVFPLVTHQ